MTSFAGIGGVGTSCIDHLHLHDIFIFDDRDDHGAIARIARLRRVGLVQLSNGHARARYSASAPRTWRDGVLARCDAVDDTSMTSIRSVLFMVHFYIFTFLGGFCRYRW